MSDTDAASRTITLNGAESRMLLEALAGLFARSGVAEEVTAAFKLAQRLEGFTIDGRPGATKVVDQASEEEEQA